jgi:tRNA U34 5-methylaminomethyl-2-thiouridine-forming methyltransferase MnmC
VFAATKVFENRVREILRVLLHDSRLTVEFDPPTQSFPDIAASEFGTEVKFSLTDTWRSMANSVLESNCINSVKAIYIVF